MMTASALPASSDATTADSSQAMKLVVELARMMHTSGAPAHELEERMEGIAEALSVPARFFSTPTSIFVTFRAPVEQTKLVRVSPASINLEKLSQLYELHRSIQRGAPSLAKLEQAMREIEQPGKSPHPAWTILCFGIATGTAAIFFGGGLEIAGAAGVIGAVVGAILIFCQWAQQPAHLAELAAAFVATLLAGVSTLLVPESAFEITLLASLIILVPGLSITVSINELATQNLAAGTARMAGALTTFLTLTLGIVMGQGVLTKFMTIPPPTALNPLAWWYLLPALALTAVALTFLFRAKFRDYGWVLLAAIIAFGGAKLGGALFGSLSAAWTGAFLMGMAANCFAKIYDRPTAIMMMPGLILLVPGSLGFFSFSALAQQDVQKGIEDAFTMTIVAFSIVAGILIADAIVSPQKRRGPHASSSRSSSSQEE